MSIEVIRAVVCGMVIEFGAKFKMSAGFFNHGIINGKKERLVFQGSGNGPDCFGDRNVIPDRVVISRGFKRIVKSVKRSVGQSGNHMAVGKTDRAENVQGQNGNDQKEQVPGGWFGSI